MTEIVEDKTMVEKVAEAIWNENRPHGAPGYWELDFLDQGRVKMIARACIKVMREPTDEIIEASPAISTMAGPPWEEMGKMIWQRMIDAALKED